jgi:hypothetical protein
MKTLATKLLFLLAIIAVLCVYHEAFEAPRLLQEEKKLSPAECIAQFGEIVDNCLSGEGCCVIVATGLSVGAIVGISIAAWCGFCACCSTVFASFS